MPPKKKANKLGDEAIQPEVKVNEKLPTPPAQQKKQ